MSSLAIQVLAALALLAAAADGARILAVVPIQSRSHHIAVSGVTRALADRGHEVTFFSGLPRGNKINPANNKVIHLDIPTAKETNNILEEFWGQKIKPPQMLLFLMQWGVQLANATFSSPIFQAEVYKPGQKWDLILTEVFFFQEATVALGHKLNCPVVAISPFGSMLFINEYMGNPVNPSWVPSPFLGFSDQMSFMERLKNSLMHAAMTLVYNWYHLPNMQALVDEHFPDAPPLEEMLRTNLGLTLINNHFTLAYPSPMSPNVVEIGGIHISDKPKPLPKDLQDFMDSAKEGVVYFSMGSNLKVESMPEEKKAAILGALGAIKQRVLLKWDGPLPKDLSPNIRHIEWAPQGDLLAHPNMRAFFTHGGLLGTQEAVYHGVPLIGTPIFGDQQFNMMLAVNKGFCVRVPFADMTREMLDEALREILQNPKYKEAASRLSRLFRNKPLTPAQSAVFAVETVINHGADHLRPSSVGMPLYQLLLVDVILAVLAPVVALLLCCRALCCGKKKAVQTTTAAKKKKNN